MSTPSVSGTDKVFRALTREKPRLMGYIRRRTGDAAESEDIYQEALLKIARRVDSGHRVADPLKYVYRVITNLIRDNYRRQQSEPQEELTDDILCQRPLPDQHMEAKERLEFFVAYLNTLPEKTRHIIIRRKLHGDSYRQIASEMGMTEYSVERRLNRAMHNLEARMTEQLASKERTQVRGMPEEPLYE